MAKSSRIQRIVVTGLLIGFMSHCGLWAQAGGSDAVLKMIPADCLFCVRINNLDQTLGQLDQFLMGASPVNVGMMAKMQLGQVLGNPMLAGVKTDGAFVVFAVAPAGEVKDPKVIANSISILVPVSDYSQFTTGSPKIGKPDLNGVSPLEGMGFSVTNLGGFALLGPSSGAIAATAKSLKAGPGKPLASALDADEVTAATQSPLWIYGNIQVLAKVLGPGVADKIKQAGAEITKLQAGAATPGMGMGMKGIFDMYANMADTLLKESKSVVVAVTPKPNVMVASATLAALPGTSMSDILTRPSPSSTKDWSLLSYCDDGAFMTGTSRFDMANLTKVHLKTMDMILPMVGTQISQDQVTKLKALMQDMSNAVGNELAFSATAGTKSRPFFGVKYVLTVKDKDKLLKLQDQMLELYGKDGFVSKMYAGMGLGLTSDVKRQPDSTYQGATIQASKLIFSSKDPNSQEAQVLQKMYGDGFDLRIAVLDRLALMAMGADADANIKKLIDQAKSGGPKQTAAEIKSALDLLPEAKNADMIFTLNYLRILGTVIPAMMPMPMPQVNFQSKSNLVFAGSIDKGRTNVQVALPKEHLTEIIQAVQMMMMQQMQQQQKAGGPNPTPQRQ